MIPIQVACLVLLCSVLSASARAETIDVSRPFICALSDVQVCTPSSPCTSRPVESLDAPHFLMISVSARKITGMRPSGSHVNAKIEFVRRSAGTLFLQGAQQTFDWNLAIVENGGRMTLTLADGDDGAVAFGACIAH